MSKRYILSFKKPVIETKWNGKMYWGTLRIQDCFDQLLCEKLGFKKLELFIGGGRIRSDAELLPKDTEIVYFTFPLYRCDTGDILEYLASAPKAKVIWVPDGDRRMWNYKKEEKEEFIKRCNLILDGQWDTWPSAPNFSTVWPEYVSKYMFFPRGAYCPEEWFSDCEFNEEPVMKCLFTGRIGNKYGLRWYLIQKMLEDRELKNIIDCLRHPSLVITEAILDYLKLNFVNEQDIVGKEYVFYLNRYFCSVADGGQPQLLVLKYFEVPATGALLLAERIPGLDKCGFIPDEHYVPIEVEYNPERPASSIVVKSDIAEVIKKVLKNPEKYQEIRKNGMEFVRKNHSINNRFEQFEKLLEELLNAR